MSRRLGFMGGMFDPVHLGHISAAKRALELLQLDELRLIPCAIPNHRKAAAASADDRVAMLNLATQEEARLLVDRRELARSGISYTVDTLNSLHQEFPAATLVMVLGQDSFNSLPQWDRWQEIFELCHLCVINRPGSENHPEDSRLSELLAKRQVDTAEALFAAAAGSIIRIADQHLDIASSEVRRHRNKGSGAIDDMLAPAVAEYIAARNLYGQDNDCPDQH